MPETRHPPILLASSSPRRRELLLEAGFDIEILAPSDVEELTPGYLTVGESTLLNARLKAQAVAGRHPERVTLAADTLVAIDARILGKPRDLVDAQQMLERLQGRTHEVFSGVWLLHPASGRRFGFVEVSRVTFRPLATDEILDYMRVINPMDKAGAYAAQHDPVGVIRKIEGSRSNVIGLPMETLQRVLAGFC